MHVENVCVYVDVCVCRHVCVDVCVCVCHCVEKVRACRKSVCVMCVCLLDIVLVHLLQDVALHQSLFIDGILEYYQCAGETCC